jgi:hypothetical protein
MGLGDTYPEPGRTEAMQPSDWALLVVAAAIAVVAGRYSLGAAHDPRR